MARTASIPPMSGITMSIVTRSGLSWRYRSTAWEPVSASPMTSYPAWVRMSVIIVRMKIASSQTSTVWATVVSLVQASRRLRTQRLGSEQRAEQRLERQPGHPGDAAADVKIFDLVDLEPDPPAEEREHDQPFAGRGIGQSQQHRRAHGCDQRAAHIGEPANRRWSARNPRQHRGGDNLAHGGHRKGEPLAARATDHQSLPIRVSHRPGF